MASSLHRLALSQSTSESPNKKPICKTEPSNCTLERRRDAAVLDLDEKVSVIATSFFFDYLLPPSPLSGSKTASDVVQEMKDTGRIQDEYWVGWSKPSASTELENVVFQKLEHLTKAIRGAAGLRSKITVKFKCNGAISLNSHTRDNTSKPDCYAIRDPDIAERRFVKDRSGRDQPSWLDVAVPGEFKKTKGHFNDNAKKVLWSMHHIMREDARRRFIVGFSIDDTDLRLWYFSRSDAYVSQVIDFLKDHKLVVDFFLRVSYASPQQLGWDPTITIHTLRNGQPPEYDIQVASTVGGTFSIRTFRTMSILSNIGADTLHGRGTRVWEVAELDESGNVKPGDTVVLKDSWVDEDREREGTIIAKILHQAKNAPKVKPGKESPEYTILSKSFLTTVTFGDVEIDGEVDETRPWTPPETLDELEVVIGSSERGKIVSGGDPDLAAVGTHDIGTSVPASRSVQVGGFSSKIHHRIVFKEVGKPLQRATSLCEGFKCLSKIIYALWMLHKLGWVHRDISGGNILITNDGVAKLADLEYAKRQEDTSPHGMRTGTKYFMALEVDYRTYLHQTIREPSDVDESGHPLDPMDGFLELDNHDHSVPCEEDQDHGSQDETTLPSAVTPIADSDSESDVHTVPFKHNPLHDLESIFWLGVFMLFAGQLVSDGNKPPTPPTDLARHTRAQNRLAVQLFRVDAFRFVMASPNGFLKEVKKPGLNDRVRQVAVLLDQMLKVLLKAYKEAEKDLSEPIPFDIAITLNVYNPVIRCLNRIEKMLDNGDIVVVLDEVSRQKLKRGEATEAAPSPPDDADDDDDDDDPRPAKKQKKNGGSGSKPRGKSSGTSKSSRFSNRSAPPAY